MGRHGYADFEALKEDFNDYLLSDGSWIRIKYVLIKVAHDRGEKAAALNGTVVAGNIPHPDLRGKPGTPMDPGGHGGEEDLEFRAMREEWNEYLLEDMTSLSVKPVLTVATRASQRDPNGDPVYMVNWQVITKVRPGRA